jgi:hypothetical protein
MPSRLVFALVTMNRPDAPAAAVRPRAMVSEHVTAARSRTRMRHATWPSERVERATHHGTHVAWQWMDS